MSVNMRILTTGVVPQTVQELMAVLSALRATPGVLQASLSTADGLPIDPEITTTQLAAVAGFMLAAAQQSFTMLGVTAPQQVVISTEGNGCLVCYPFYVGQSRLALTVLCQRSGNCTPLLENTVAQIQQIMEK